MPISGFAESYGNFMFNFLRNRHSKAAASFFIPTSNIKEFQFLHMLDNICFLKNIYYSQPNGYKVISHCQSHFMDTNSS